MAWPESCKNKSIGWLAFSAMSEVCEGEGGSGKRGVGWSTCFSRKIGPSDLLAAPGDLED